MRKSMYILFLCLGTGVSCQNTNSGNKGQVNETIAVNLYEEKLNSIEQLIDVRTPDEYKGGHIKGALNYNINGDAFEKQIEDLDKNKAVMVYCLSGGRSASAANRLAELGFKEVYNLEGGIMKWNSENKPLEMGEGAIAHDGMSLAEFQKLTSSKHYVLVDFYAVWCKPCQKLSPILEAVAAERTEKMVLVKVDADEHTALTKAKNISGIPYLELYEDGKLVWKHEGFIEKEQFLAETKL